MLYFNNICSWYYSVYLYAGYILDRFQPGLLSRRRHPLQLEGTTWSDRIMTSCVTLHLHACWSGASKLALICSSFQTTTDLTIVELRSSFAFLYPIRSTLLRRDLLFFIVPVSVVSRIQGNVKKCIWQRKRRRAIMNLTTVLIVRTWLLVAGSYHTCVVNFVFQAFPRLVLFAKFIKETRYDSL